MPCPLEFCGNVSGPRPKWTREPSLKHMQWKKWDALLLFWMEKEMFQLAAPSKYTTVNSDCVCVQGGRRWGWGGVVNRAIESQTTGWPLHLVTVTAGSTRRQTVCNTDRTLLCVCACVCLRPVSGRGIPRAAPVCTTRLIENVNSSKQGTRASKEGEVSFSLGAERLLCTPELRTSSRSPCPRPRER